jgi:heme exporter protein A
VLSRLLAAPRPLWLLDEPLSPLDARWRTRFGEMMQAHLAGGGLILAAVHDPLPIAAQVLEIAG